MKNYVTYASYKWLYKRNQVTIGFLSSSIDGMREIASLRWNRSHVVPTSLLAGTPLTSDSGQTLSRQRCVTYRLCFT